MSRRSVKDLELDKFKRHNPIVRVTDDDIGLYNSLEVTKTLVGTTATKLTTPDSSGFFFIVHRDEDIALYIGDKSVTSSTGLPLPPNEKLEIKYFKKQDNNEIYAIAASEEVAVYCVGAKSV